MPAAPLMCSSTAGWASWCSYKRHLLASRCCMIPLPDESCCALITSSCFIPASCCCRPLLDEATLPDISLCALNMPSPDLLTPSKVAATIWSWAPGHPMKPYAAQWWLHSAVLRLRDAVKGAWRGQETLVSRAALGVQLWLRHRPECVAHTLAQAPFVCRPWAAIRVGFPDSQSKDDMPKLTSLIPCCAAPMHCH